MCIVIDVIGAEGFALQFYSLKLKVILRFFKCMESMARDLRHPYITKYGSIYLA